MDDGDIQPISADRFLDVVDNLYDSPLTEPFSINGISFSPRDDVKAVIEGDPSKRLDIINRYVALLNGTFFIDPSESVKPEVRQAHELLQNWVNRIGADLLRDNAIVIVYGSTAYSDWGPYFDPDINIWIVTPDADVTSVDLTNQRYTDGKFNELYTMWQEQLGGGEGHCSVVSMSHFIHYVNVLCDKIIGENHKWSDFMMARGSTALLTGVLYVPQSGTDLQQIMHNAHDRLKEELLENLSQNPIWAAMAIYDLAETLHKRVERRNGEEK